MINEFFTNIATALGRNLIVVKPLKYEFISRISIEEYGQNSLYAYYVKLL